MSEQTSENSLEMTKLRIENGEVENIFDCLTDILLKLSGGRLHEFRGFSGCFSKYLVCRYLSMRESLVPAAEALNRYQEILDDSQFYRLAYSIVPKQRRHFIRYLKGQKKKKPEKDETAEMAARPEIETEFDL